jgi:MoaA/NifB/PqqE/SkfB family radical SAM enzyme
MRLPVVQKELTLQWHITEKCDFRCKFCYIPHLQKDKRKDFPTQKAFEIIEDFSRLIKKLKIIGRINFTGGNPLLHRDFFELIKSARKEGLRFGILGNPTATEEQLKELKKLRIFRYQISLDGLESTHDYFRGKGRFREAIEFLKLEGEVGITRVVLSTVSKKIKRKYHYWPSSYTETISWRFMILQG